MYNDGDGGGYGGGDGDGIWDDGGDNGCEDGEEVAARNLYQQISERNSFRWCFVSMFWLQYLVWQKPGKRQVDTWQKFSGKEFHLLKPLYFDYMYN